MAEPFVDVLFKVMGREIEVDHGFSLYSAISKILPWVHESKEIGIAPINGTLAGNRQLSITETSKLMIRLPVPQVKDILPLAGKNLIIGPYTILLGVPSTKALIGSVSLYSRLVIIKSFTEPAPFLEAVERQLVSIEIKAKPSLVAQPEIAEKNKDSIHGARSPFLRRTIRIHEKQIVGFAVRIEGLTAEESIIVQEKGVGGRRKFGCGVFIGINDN